MADSLLIDPQPLILLVLGSLVVRDQDVAATMVGYCLGPILVESYHLVNNVRREHLDATPILLK